MRTRGRSAAGLMALALVVGCGSSASTGADAGPGADACMALVNDYMSALGVAENCMPGAANQCTVEIELQTACHCHVFVNAETDTLARAAMALAQAGCPNKCVGDCIVPKSATCIQHIEGTSCLNVTK